MRKLHQALLVILSVGLVGCSHYTVPGGPARLQNLQPMDPDLRKAFDAKPQAKFPAMIAAVRIQSNDYESRTAQAYGGGSYKVITTRDVESAGTFERLGELPGIAGIAPLNRMLLPANLQSEDDLRKAAARVQADVLLIYTFDTQFYVKDFAAPVTVFTLGLSPNRRAFVTTTASAILIDTRTGFVYGGAEASAKSNQLANGWTSDDAVDDTRLRTEAESFDKLVGEVEKAWAGIVKQHGLPATQPTTMP